MSRPNPRIQLGAIDCSAAIIVCDLALADSPIVYASDPFCELTGYSVTECLGRNCRFLQQPPKSASGKKSSSKPCSDDDNQASLKQLHHAVHNIEETQVAVTNFKKNGEWFTNLVSIVPLEKEPSGNQYAIGFQVQID
ncbi:White collar 1 protein [Escovopsis weberi]|uniref:White collar 1 protein n=1 Tax=Escovopsis weberi TaxID=150374 RepID=A0A0M9VS66_ESCWE|nr:White collar 1 protein [Escovopsis weberi]